MRLSVYSAAEQFRDAIRAAGIEPPDLIEPTNGARFKRFSASGKRGDDAGWYAYYDDGTPAGAFGCWRTGISGKWCAKTDRDLTAEERAANAKRLADSKAAAETERQCLNAEARAKANAIWKAGTAADGNPYLQRKGVGSVASLKEMNVTDLQPILGYLPKARDEQLSGRILLVPIKIGTELSTVEMIDETGRKSALYGGAKRSGYWAAQTLPQDDGAESTVLISEGVATALSAKEATGHRVVAALSSGNLQAVAQAMRKRYPAAKLVILGDLGNGQDKARAAARAARAALAIPEFGPNAADNMTDFNDQHTLLGLESVKASIDGAIGRLVEAEADVVVRRISDIQAKPVRWLWPGRLARGKVSLIVGHPGLGKSQVTAALAAIVTTGGRWPVDRGLCERGSAVFLSAEDDPADTIRPRLEAAGSDLSRVYVLDAVRDRCQDGEIRARAFNLVSDIARLGALLRQIGDVGLLVVDPISAYLGDADSHNNADVRAVLAPLSEMASIHGVAVVAVSHLSKSSGNDALLRVQGSIAFSAAARAVWGVARNKDDPARRLFLPLKNNLGTDETGLAFAVEGCTVSEGIQTSRVVWEGEPVTVSAEEAFAPEIDRSDRTERDEAAEWLRDLLLGVSLTAKEVQAEANKAGLAWRTVQRAKEAAGVVSFREGFGRDARYIWKLKTTMCANEAHVRQPLNAGTHEGFGTHGESKVNVEVL